MNLQLVILVIFSTIAAVSSILISLVVVARKSLDEKRAIRRQRLHRMYSSRFAELLLCELTPLKVEPRPHSVFKQYDELLRPLQRDLSRMASGVQRLHLDAMQVVLFDFARDVTGESFERLVYFFDELSLADRELDRLHH